MEGVCSGMEFMGRYSRKCFLQGKMYLLHIRVPISIFQLSEQLKTHYVSWIVSLNVKQSLSMSSSIRNPITHAARDKSRALQAPSVPSQAPAVNNVSQGFNIPPFAATSEATAHVNQHVSPATIPPSNPLLRLETTSTEPSGSISESAPNRQHSESCLHPQIRVLKLHMKSRLCSLESALLKSSKIQDHKRKKERGALVGNVHVRTTLANISSFASH